MTKRIRVGRSVTELWKCDAGFAIDDLEEFPATTIAGSTVALAVMDNEEFTREHVNWSGQIARVFVLMI